MTKLQRSLGSLRVFSRWALLECDDQIGAMYRSLYSLEYFYKPRINKPLWGSHVSIIRGEIDLNLGLKAELEGQVIEFYYVSSMDTNGCHYYLPVICPVLDTIRQEFNLGPSKVAYHLSIGNTIGA